MINGGYFYINTAEPHTVGLFDNNGVIDDTQNGIDTGATGFTNNNIVITNTYFNCPSSLTPAFDYGGATNYTVEGIYSDAAATMSAGIYNASTNTFVPTAPLLNNTTSCVLC